MKRSSAQQQTSDVFGHKWAIRDDFDSEASRAHARSWLLERYGDIENASWWSQYGMQPSIVDAGCGAGFSAIELFGSRLKNTKYTGVDISSAHQVAEKRFAERGFPGVFLQADILDLPFPDETFDVAFSEGVLHHTDSTRDALLAVASKIKRGGRFLFYVYRKKGPVREFTDDYVREKLQHMSPDEALNTLYPLTKLGEALGKLNIDIEVTDAVEMLGIPAGKINLQRLFYWHFCKAFYRPELTVGEMNLINFDWYAPKNAHRQTLAEVLSWCDEAGLTAERVVEQEAGITVIAMKR
jgi:arsenite methyltransferase